MFSYDSSALGTSDAEGRKNLVRLKIGDTTNVPSRPAVFQDEELLALLTDNGDSVSFAAASACEAWAADASRRYKRMERDGSIDERHTIADLLKLAAALRAQGAAGASSGTLQTGRITSADQGYLDERRPDWISVHGHEIPIL